MKRCKSFVIAGVFAGCVLGLAAGAVAGPSRPSLALLSTARPSVQHQRNGRGLQLTLVIESEIGGTSRAANGVSLASGFLAARQQAPRRNAVQDWTVYE